MLFRFRARLHPVSLGCQTSWTRWRPAGSRFLSAAPQGNQTKAPSSSRWPPDPKLRYRLCKNTETSSLKTRLVSFRDTENDDVGGGGSGAYRPRPNGCDWILRVSVPKRCMHVQILPQFRVHFSFQNKSQFAVTVLFCDRYREKYCTGWQMSRYPIISQ